jgi:hypothetical protein
MTNGSLGNFRLREKCFIDEYLIYTISELLPNCGTKLTPEHSPFLAAFDHFNGIIKRPEKPKVLLETS